MSLDQNLFTLRFSSSQTDPNVVDLVDSSGAIHYRKQRIHGPVYAIRLYDFVSESLLVTATSPSATSKVKILELRNPSVAVELEYTGTFTFKWSFQWEDHEFEWRREECYMIRKPDPPVLVAITKEPAGRLKSTSVQVLDYNLNRFDIEDRKGLEIVILTALLTFNDSNEAQHTSKDEDLVNQRKVPWTVLSPFGNASQRQRTTSHTITQTPDPAPSSSRETRSRKQSAPAMTVGTACNKNICPVVHAPAALVPSKSCSVPRRESMPMSSSPSPPTPPPTPPPSEAMPLTMPNVGSPTPRDQRHHSDAHRTHNGTLGRIGVDLIAEMQAHRLKVHEVVVYSEGLVDDYATFCWMLLQDEAMRFISIRSNSGAQVQKVLEIAEETKRFRYQTGPYIELQQFVTYDPLPEAPTRQRLEEKNKLLAAKTKKPKDIKKEIKRKEKKKAKAKKGESSTDNNPFLERQIEIEEFVIPPKSVAVRLTKMEVRTSVPTTSVLTNEAGPSSKKANEHAKKGAKDKVKGKEAPTLPLAPDPRFLVQQPPSELIPRYTAQEKRKGKARAEFTTLTPTQTRSTINPRRTASEVFASKPSRFEDHKIDYGDHRSRPDALHTHHSAPDRVQYPDRPVSQMFLRWSSPTERSKIPGLPQRDNLTVSSPNLVPNTTPLESTHDRLNSELPPVPLVSSSSSPELQAMASFPEEQVHTRKSAPALPPLAFSRPEVAITDAPEMPVAGPSRTTDMNLQAPPSYTEMPSAGESPLDESAVVIEKGTM